MPGFLFDDIVFGPVKSRRFGVSLGINLLPETMKYCSFNCIYCECGLTSPDQEKRAGMYKTGEVINALRERFGQLRLQGLKPDNITFAGNGEPTLHHGFGEIVSNTIALRQEFFPEAKITVLSNATRLHIASVREALMRIDNNVLKLDAGSETMFKLINRPASPVKLSAIVDNLASFEGRLVIQTMFLRGKINDQMIDNTTEEETALWLNHLIRIKPALVMLYSVSRETPEQNIEKVGFGEMQRIASKLDAVDIPFEVYQ